MLAKVILFAKRHLVYLDELNYVIGNGKGFSPGWEYKLRWIQKRLPSDSPDMLINPQY